MRRSFPLTIAALIILAASIALWGAPGRAGYSNDETVELGLKVANRVLDHRRGLMDVRYEMSCSRYGILIFAKAADQPQLLERMEKIYRPFRQGWARPMKGHVDFNVFGIVGFELYIQTQDPAYLPLAKKLADNEYKGNREDGLCDYTRFWVDDMWMVGALQTQAYRATHDPVYADRAINQLLAYCDALQQEDGLFYHSQDSPHYWGRGNGWAAAAMAAALLDLPWDHARYEELLSAYQKQMAALIKVQHGSGMWNQLLDEPESYLESSCSGMFLFALATGIGNGWLPYDEYKPAVERGWEALKGYVDGNGDIRSVCVGTGRLDSTQYYLDRPARTGDLHGMAAFLWAATAMYRLENK